MKTVAAGGKPRALLTAHDINWLIGCVKSGGHTKAIPIGASDAIPTQMRKIRTATSCEIIVLMRAGFCQPRLGIPEAGFTRGPLTRHEQSARNSFGSRAVPGRVFRKEAARPLWSTQLDISGVLPDGCAFRDGLQSGSTPVYLATPIGLSRVE